MLNIQNIYTNPTYAYIYKIYVGLCKPKLIKEMGKFDVGIFYPLCINGWINATIFNGGSSGSDFPH